MSFFNNIKLKILSKISNWENKLFLSRGKEVSIKAITQAIPTYAMHVFKIPLGLYANIQRTIARFWWNSKEDHRSIHRPKWEKMCTSKQKCGIGFRDLSSFNQALVAKQGWRLIQFLDSLMAKVLKVQHFKKTNFFKCKIRT